MKPLLFNPLSSIRTLIIAAVVTSAFALAISGCISMTYAVDPPTTFSTSSRRTLIVFAPGTKSGKMKYFAALNRLGIRYEVGLQINSWLPLKEHFPETIHTDRINAREGFVKADAEWNPKPPILAYYDYEPDNGSWNWDVQERGHTNADLRFLKHALAELRAHQRQTGSTLPIALYGQPVSRRDRAWTQADLQKVIMNKPMLEGFDWINFEIYARHSVITKQTEARHRRRISHNWEQIQEIYPDRPIVPMLYLNVNFDEGEYGRVYFDELNKLGVPTLALWANPDSDEETRQTIKMLEDNAQYIRAWQRGDSD